MLVNEQKYIFSKITTEINNGKHTILVTGRPGLGKTFLSTEIIKSICEKPILIQGVGLTIDKIDSYDLAQCDGIILDEVASISQDLLEKVIAFIKQASLLQIPLIATAPSISKVNGELQKLFETYEILPFSNESILVLLSEKRRNENIIIPNDMLPTIISESKGIPRMAIEITDITNGKNIDTNEIYNIGLSNFYGENKYYFIKSNEIKKR